MDKRNATKQGTGIQHEQQQYRPVLVLNDMGGAKMDVTYDLANTLRGESKLHEPIVLVAAGFKGGQEQWRVE